MYPYFISDSDDQFILSWRYPAQYSKILNDILLVKSRQLLQLIHPLLGTRKSDVVYFVAHFSYDLS